MFGGIIFTVGILAAFLGQANAFWRLNCAKINTGRMDAVVSPGKVSSHTHTFVGNIGVNSTFDTLSTAECSSCENQKDKSSYWSPALYYQYANGSLSEVPHDGSVIYYLGRGVNQTFEPFPEGLRMLSGDSAARSYDSTTMTYSDSKNAGRPVADRVSWACLAAQAEPETYGLENTDCVNGLRAQIHFQSCWDGVNLYKSDQSHVAYLSHIDDGICPPTHPRNLPHLFMETLYPVNNVAKEAGGRFVLANGDPTGYGFHADFINGWNRTVLQAGIQECLNNTANIYGVIGDCAPLAVEGDLVKNYPQLCPARSTPIQEQYNGLLDKLPGCNQITEGPDRAPSSSQSCPSGIIPPAIIPTADSTPIVLKSAVPGQPAGLTGWNYVGCGNDTGPSGRALLSASTTTANMTWETCQSFCASKSYRYAGVEYYSECYCDNYINNNAQWNQTHCETPCKGTNTEMCGGAAKVMVFENTAVVKVPPKVSYTSAVGKYSHKGCYKEATSGRALSGYSFTSKTMTPQSCVKQCLGRKMKFAGVEYGTECYCGNTLNSQTKASLTDCNMYCGGNGGDTQAYCGGPARLNLYYTTEVLSY